MLYFSVKLSLLTFTILPFVIITSIVLTIILNRIYDASKVVIELEEGKMLVPGFIDQHIHGAAGSDAMDGTKEDLLKISNALAIDC